MKLQQLAVLLDQSTRNRSYQKIEGQKLDRSRCKLSHSNICFYILRFSLPASSRMNHYPIACKP